MRKVVGLLVLQFSSYRRMGVMQGGLNHLSLTVLEAFASFPAATSLLSSLGCGSIFGASPSGWEWLPTCPWFISHQ